MTSASRPILAVAIALLLSTLCAVPQADARRIEGVHVRPHVASNVRVGTASNCNYYYRRWKATGSAYWHDRYYENCR